MPTGPLNLYLNGTNFQIKSLGGFAAHPSRRGGLLRTRGNSHRSTELGARRQPGGGAQSRRGDYPLSPGDPQDGRHRRLSLGNCAQACTIGMGDGARLGMKTSHWIALFSVYLFWGGTYLAIRFGVETIPPFTLAAVRFLVAGTILFTWRRLAGDPMPKRFEWRSAAIVGLLMLLGGNGGLVWAEQRVNSGVAALLVGSVPMFMVMIDGLRPGGRRPTLGALLGVLFGFGGIALLISPTQWVGASHAVDPLGVLALLVGSLLWSLGSLVNRDARLPESPLLGTGMAMLAGGAGLLLAATLTGEWGRLDLAAVSTRSLFGLVYLIVFGSLVGFAAYTWLLRVAPTPLVSTYAYVNPLVALLLGTLLAGEPLTPRVLVSALIIVSSIALITLTRNTTQRRRRSLGTAPSVLGED